MVINTFDNDPYLETYPFSANNCKVSPEETKALLHTNKYVGYLWHNFSCKGGLYEKRGWSTVGTAGSRPLQEIHCRTQLSPAAKEVALL